MEHEIAAATFDAIQRLSYYFVTANGGKNAKEPDPYPRPGGDSPAETADLQGFANFLKG